MNQTHSNEVLDKPLVSIISLFYNRAIYVKPSVDSLLKQTYSNVEIILVDDGSTDNTLDELASYQDPRIRLLTHENKGLVRALRGAIASSQGELIAIHGSGDISLPDRIEMQVDLLMRNPDVGVVGCYMRNFNMVKNTWEVVCRTIAEDQLSQLINYNLFSHGEVMFRRSCYDQVGGYREFFEFAQDHDLWLRMATVTRFAIVPKILYQREPIEGSVSSVSKVPSKVKKQTYLSEFAVACAMTRRDQGFDPLERDGHKAFESFANTSSILPIRLTSLVFSYLVGKKFDVAKELMSEVVALNPSRFNKFYLTAITWSQKSTVFRKPLLFILRLRLKLIRILKSN
ncbi:glycosyltransferase [Anabaenopsis tanganyikae CS-531]|uniref:Glycosyltransferase n=2 Tax=Anabaenopsis TaxID=110103 RepID=A0ABT5AVV6_9CYAN|nr:MULTISPECIES: glycosyltransferase [Anabaenopsis]MDB9541456.1 glycosyltransferase [Anabaenopsis arnoldii]MDH6090435.1 glycosyltransferase [Anabaenopsis arnoldii]MDH6105381.1 glycosyltransferase [Anabaenopsis tanganyikae CS-531]